MLGKSSRGKAARYYRPVAFVTIAVLVISASFQLLFANPKAASAFTVPGESYEICDNAATYLTSPWTYDGLASGSQNYTVSQYEALPGYGTTLPPLPSYISSEGPSANAAMIFAPGSTTNIAAYDVPSTPIIYFFEGGTYNDIALETISGDEFIGGSANGYGEPMFNNAGAAEGIDAGNGTFYFSGGTSTLAGTYSNTNTVTTTSAIPGYIQWLTFSDGSTYQITNVTNGGLTLTLGSNVTATEAAGSQVWANSSQPLAEASSSASQGSSSLTLTSSTLPQMKYASIMINDEAYTINSVSGSQSGYTLGFTGGLDMNIAANTPIYYNAQAGDVTVEYLNINNDQHLTTGTIYTGSGWTIEHNNIHDGNSKGPGFGVALYGGDEGTIEYNCLSKMGDYGMNIFGTGNQFDYNEVYESNYKPDPGCGCSGGGKWWGTLNADILDNAFVNDAPGGSPPVWLDNGNSGTQIAGNYFDMSAGNAISAETGFNLLVDNNLFLNGGWSAGGGDCGVGTGADCNGSGSVSINTSGGFQVPGSRYENQITISNNQFQNDWGGVSIWQSGARSCENSGEGWPADAPYCSGGFPNTATPSAGGQYYFSHDSDSNRGGTSSLVQSASPGATKLLLDNSQATDDQIGFGNPAMSTTTDTTNVASFTAGSPGTINAATAGFPSSGQIRVGTSTAWNDTAGSFTGAILSYTGVTASTFTGVVLVRGSGILGPEPGTPTSPVQQVQPYQVTSETCYANDCAVTISPGLSAAQTAGTEVSNAGTCQLFATSTALPSGPLAPDGTSYWDGCQWDADHIAVTGNHFIFQPSQIAASTPLLGNRTTTTCSSTNTDSCGSNFMQYQEAGEAPFNNQIGGNAMMSSSTFTGCPSWDTGCTSDPLSNVNALASPPGAPAGNGEAPGNDVWSGNTYSGPWVFYGGYYGNCQGLAYPTDPNTNKTMPNTDCSAQYPLWQSAFQQDTGSTYNPLLVTLNGVTPNQEIQSSAQSVKAFEDTQSPSTISSTLSLNSSNAQTLSSSPFDFSVNTLNYPDGPYTLKVASTDSNSNSSSDSASVYISNGDLNGDGIINLSDLAVMASHYGATDPNYSDGNISGQSTINLSDLAILAANWGWSHP